jgi:hypothetical protein
MIEKMHLFDLASPILHRAKVKEVEDVSIYNIYSSLLLSLLSPIPPCATRNSAIYMRICARGGERGKEGRIDAPACCGIGDCSFDSAAVESTSALSTPQALDPADNPHTGGCASDSAAVKSTSALSTPQACCAADNPHNVGCAFDIAPVEFTSTLSTSQALCPADNPHTGGCSLDSAPVESTTVLSTSQALCPADNPDIGDCASNNAAVRPTGPLSAEQSGRGSRVCMRPNARGCCPVCQAGNGSFLRNGCGRPRRERYGGFFLFVAAANTAPFEGERTWK